MKQLLLIVILVLPLILKADPKGDEIAARTLQATKAEKLKDFKTFKFIFSNHNHMDTVVEKGMMIFDQEKYYVKQTVQGKDGIFSYNGTNGWFVAPFLNVDSITRMTPQMVKYFDAQFRQQLSYMKGIFYGYKKDGIVVDFEKDTTIEGNKVHMLKLTTPNAVTQVKVFVGVNKKLIHGMDIANSQGLTQLRFDDYKTINGMKFLTKIRTIMGGQHISTFQFDEILINEEIPLSQFDTP